MLAWRKREIGPVRADSTKRVSFLIAGVQKGGTNSLNAYLEAHPDVWMPPEHDPHFFDADWRFQTASPDYAPYHACFAAAPVDAIWGEATPIYAYWPEAARRIHVYRPSIKIILLLRNPVERAWSHWRMEHERGADAMPFAEAIRCEPERLREALPEMHRVYSYVDRGFYSEQIRRLRRYFRDEQLLFLKSERMFYDAAAVLGETLRFLGLESRPADTSVVHYAGADRGPMDLRDRAYLLERFREDIALTERLLDWDCADWKQ